ncbi:uncharacterized protein RJT20DRAFT_132174 [Scheffersomyces xylosifermentans]|uniref:uncharacterized protein n=1 Tax=Scheffersomyces xylosifermentans TaxID=1304137 RepID=UPI00315DE21C
MSGNNAFSSVSSAPGNKLLVPRHSYSNSVASNTSNLTPQFLSNTKTNRSGSSGLRLSRTNTNNTDLYTNTNTNPNSNTFGNDTPSLRTIDKIPSTRPSVSYSDKLWTQIDVLDDVKKMANQVRQKGSFFNEKFNEELAKLKESQNKLLDTMSSQHFNDIGNKERSRQLASANPRTSSLNLIPTTSSTSNPREDLMGSIAESNSAESEKIKKRHEKSKLKQEKLNSFFDDEDVSKSSRDILYRKQNFEEMNQYVDHIKEDLVNVGEAMKRFDETTREMW